MKKLFILALGAFLVLAFSAGAMAETKVDFKGTYRVRAFYKNNFNLNSESDDESKESYFDNRVRIDFQLMPSDQLTMNIGLTTEDWRWGKTSQGTFVTRPTTAQTDDGIVSFELRYAYMDIKTGIGLFKIGRMPGSAPGLAALGWTGTWLGSGFLDDATASARDRIAYILPMGNFQLIAVYDKKNELDDASGKQGTRAVNKYDQDWDEWSITPIYKFANGGVTATFAYNKLNSQFYKLETGSILGAGVAELIPAPVRGALATAGYTVADIGDIDGYYWAVNPAVVYNFGPLGVHVEALYASGKGEWNNPTGTPTSWTDPTTGKTYDVKDEVDLMAWAFYADVTYKFGPGLAGIQYAYVSGDESGYDYDVDGIQSIGADFTPFLIVYDRGTSFKGTLPNGVGMDISDSANHWMVGGWVDYSLTEDLMLHAALGYFAVNEIPSKNWDKHVGTEFDIGLKYNIMSNLTYQIDAGYFWTGDYYKMGVSTNDVGNAYCIKNTLQISF
jgi:hypothetical protein